MRRVAWLLVVAFGVHVVGGWALAGTSAAAQLLSPGPHAVVAGALLLGFVLLRLFVLVVAPGIVVMALLAALGRGSLSRG